jgi:putative pyoverdin transport system ATP-binding/permease protein
MNVIRFFTRNAHSKLFVAVAAGMISGLSSMVLLALFATVLKGGSQHSAFKLTCVLLGLCLFLPLTRFISEVVLLRLAQGELFDLRMRLSRRILQSGLRHLETLGSEPLMTALTEDIPVIVDALHLIPPLCLNIAIALSGFIYLGWLSWRILSLILGFFVLGLLVYELPSRLSGKHFRAARQELDALWGHFKDLTEGMKELKLHSRRRHVFLFQVLRDTAAARSKHLLRAFNFHGIANSLGQMLVFVAIGLILFFYAGGHSGIAVTAGSIITLLYITSALQFIMNELPSILSADIALEKLNELTQQLESPAAMELQQDIPTDAGLACERLSLKAITHAYHSKQAKEAFTLGPLDINLKAGELVLVAGGNGSGKTTLAKIITGLYRAESGELLLDGQPITDGNREFYRQHFSAVFYDFHLFESLLGLEKPDLDAHARERLERLQLNGKVTIENGVFSTTQLSQGQRKRLALLTATLEDRPIYVFDEWAADQDPEFKDYFYRELLPDLKAQGKLVLIICHDDHYFDVADRMIKLEAGKIIYDGVPAVC